MAKHRQKPKRAQRAPASSVPRAGAIGVCWAIAALVSAFLAWGSLTGRYLPGCDGAGNCAEVLGSKYAYAFGVPVSIPGVAIYALGLLALAKPAIRADRPRLLPALSLIILLSVGWFVLVQAAALKAFCPWCLAAHAAGAIGAVLALRTVKLPQIKGAPVIGAVAAVVTLIAGHSSNQPRTPAAEASMAQAGAPSPKRELKLHNDQFTLDLNALPITGSPDAPHVLVSLFDYTCHVCRDLHALLIRAQAANSNKLAIVHLPNPLDAACNPHMQRTADAHLNACEYAKIGLAVWQADPAKFDAFTHSFFIPTKPMPVEESMRLAKGLAPEAKLAQHLGDARSLEILRLSSGLYKANYDTIRSGKMPQIILGAKIYAGLSRPDQLNAALLENGLNPIPAQPVLHQP